MRWWKILALALIFCGVLFRLWNFGNVPHSLYWDEMAIYNDALSIRETGKDLHNRSWSQPLFISYGDYKLPVYIWLTTLFSLTGSSELIVTRLPSLTAGLISILGVGVFAWLITKNERTAWFSAAAVAVMPWSMHFSRVGFEAHLSMAFLLWSLIVVVWSQQFEGKKRYFFFLISIFLGGISIYTYFSTRYVWPVVFALFALWKPSKKVQSWKWWQVGIGLALWATLMIPMYKADFYKESNQLRLGSASLLNQEQLPHEINAYRARAGNTLFARMVFNRPTFLFLGLSKNYLAYLQPEYLFFTGDPNLRHGSGASGILFISSFPLLAAGMYSLAHKRSSIFMIFTIWWIFAILPAAVPLNVPHALRSLNALPVFALLIGFGAEYLMREGEKLKKNKKVVPMVFGTALFMMFCGEYIRYTHDYFTFYPQRSATQWQDGFHQLAHYIESQRANYDRVLVQGFDDRFYLYYQPISGLSWQHIQTQPSMGFKRTTFANVDLNMKEDTVRQGRTLVIVPVSEKKDLRIKDVIYNSLGEEKYVSAESN